MVAAAATVVLVDLGVASFLQVQLGENWKIAVVEEQRSITRFFSLTLE